MSIQSVLLGDKKIIACHDETCPVPRQKDIDYQLYYFLSDLFSHCLVYDNYELLGLFATPAVLWKDLLSIA